MFRLYLDIHISNMLSVFPNKLCTMFMNGNSICLSLQIRTWFPLQHLMLSGSSQADCFHFYGEMWVPGNSCGLDTLHAHLPPSCDTVLWCPYSQSESTSTHCMGFYFIPPFFFFFVSYLPKNVFAKHLIIYIVLSVLSSAVILPVCW